MDLNDVMFGHGRRVIFRINSTEAGSGCINKGNIGYQGTLGGSSDICMDGQRTY
ncbi:hypothetical protein D3C73_790090 [compost metagenome]